MAELWAIQSNLNRGEVDPGLLGRTDLRSYYNGLEEAVNVLTQPQGGVQKRGGFRVVDNTFPFPGRMETFAFSEGDQYLVVFTAGRMYIYRNGIRQENINGLNLPYLRTNMTAEQVTNFTYVQTADTIILTEGTRPPTIIQRTSDTQWSFDSVPLQNIPQYQFNDARSPRADPQAQLIQFTDWTPGDRFRISLEGQLTDEIVYGAIKGPSTIAMDQQKFMNSPAFQRDIAEALQRLPNTGSSGISVAWEEDDPDPDNNDRNQRTRFVIRITFSGPSANAWQVMAVTPVFNISNDVPGSIATISQSTVGGSVSAEPVWSDVRGWPVSSTFHEGRLYFAGTASLPSTVWGSRLGDFFNFDNRRNLDDESLSATLDSDQVNAITSIYSNRALQIFTTGAEFAVVTPGAITPSNFAVAPQSVLGSGRLRPISLEGTTLFVQRTGRALIQYVFINEYQAHQSNSVSLLASHLINNPQEILVARGSSTVDANYVYLINEDGQVAVYNSLVAEDLAGFSRFEISGRVQSGAVVNQELHLLVRRPNGRWVIVREDKSSQLDFSVVTRGSIFNSNTIAGLDHLAGEEVAVIADGSYLGQFPVSRIGVVTLPDRYDEIEAGLFFQPRIKTLPLNIQVANGPNAAAKKKIARCAVRMLNTTGVVVNDQLLINREANDNVFGPPGMYTGIQRIFLLGWSQDAQVTLTQNAPYPWEILFIALEIKT